MMRNYLKIRPNRNPMKMQIPRPTSSDLMPRFLSLLLEIAWPKTPARMGPISGETNILATRITAIDGKSWNH